MRLRWRLTPNARPFEPGQLGAYLGDLTRECRLPVPSASEIRSIGPDRYLPLPDRRCQTSYFALPRGFVEVAAGTGASAPERRTSGLDSSRHVSDGTRRCRTHTIRARLQCSSRST